MKSPVATILAGLCVLGFLTSCGQAAQSTKTGSPEAQATTPAQLMQAIMDRLASPRLRSVELGAPPAGYSGTYPWLYFNANHSGDADGMLADFEALLAAGTYTHEAAADGIARASGVSYVDLSSAGCSASTQADSCLGGEWAISPDADRSVPTSPDAATLDATIRSRLARLGLSPISVTFDQTDANLAPVVVAEISDPTALPPDNWESIRNVAIGPDSAFEGMYFELVDSKGQAVAATAVDTILGIGISWRPPPR